MSCLIFAHHINRIKAACGYVKTCSTCEVSKAVDQFSLQKMGKHGVTSLCKVCASAYAKARFKANQLHIQEVCNAWSAKNRDKRALYGLKWKAAHPERYVEMSRGINARYREKNPGKCAEHDRKKLAGRSRGIGWGDCSPVYAEARRLSRETGVKHSVDHIFPLQGKTVSGLHVPDNLQTLESTRNSRKRNKLPGQLIELLWVESSKEVFYG